MYGKITTFTFGDITGVSIARFECTKDIILNILNLFEYKNATKPGIAIENETIDALVNAIYGNERNETYVYISKEI